MKTRRVQTQEDVERTYPCATESPIPFWADGLPSCRQWFAENLGRYVEGLHLEDESGSVIGHIYWAPGPQALVPYEIEERVAYIYCDWVQQSHRGQGGMHRLFGDFVALLRAQDYKGILVDGTEYEGYMHYRHFLKRGFQIIRESDGGKLLYYPLSQCSVRVCPVAGEAAVTSAFAESKADVQILVLGSRFCPVGASAVLAIRKVAREFGDRVVIREIPASRETMARYGIADGIFINGKVKFFGPVRESDVRKAIEEELRVEDVED